MGNIKYSFGMNQLEKLEKSHPSRTSKYNADIKNKYWFDLFDWLCSEKGKKKLNLINKQQI